MVVELRRERVAGALARKEVGNALGRDRLDLALLEALVRLSACFVRFGRGLFALSAAGQAGRECDDGDGRGYATAPIQRSQARS